MLMFRKLAQCCWQGKPEDFKQFWPLPKKLQDEGVKKVWGSVEEAIELRKQINEANKKFLEQTRKQ